MASIPDIDDVILRVPTLANAANLDIVPLEGGLSNVSYVVTSDEGRFVVRLAAGGAAHRDRRSEHEAALLASAAGFAPEVIAFLPEGHSVIRFVEAARPLTQDEMSDHSMLARLAGLLRTIHCLDPIAGSFSPYDETLKYMEIVRGTGESGPDGLPRLLDRIAETEIRRHGAYVPVLCHNDPYHLNILLEPDRLWMIDWEYAGMNDPMYDLAGVGYRQDAAGRSFLLESYFGESTAELRYELDEMIAVYLCWNVAWSLVQAGTSQIEFDYIGFAEMMMSRVQW